jgi:hypothetical protein
MTVLRDFSWWPTVWTSENGSSLIPIDIRENGVLQNVSRKGTELTLILECNGVICTAKIDSALSEEFVILLRHILLQHWGEPISSVENIEVNFDL